METTLIQAITAIAILQFVFVLSTGVIVFYWQDKFWGPYLNCESIKYDCSDNRDNRNNNNNWSNWNTNTNNWNSWNGNVNTNTGNNWSSWSSGSVEVNVNGNSWSSSWNTHQ